MKAHSQDFKDKIKLMGRQLDSKITYTIDDEEIELGKEELNSITPHYQGSLLKSVMKQLDIDSNVDIPLETEVNYQLGLLNDNEFEYLDYGNYIVYSSEKQEDTRSYKIVCYDKMLYSMVDYKGLIGISFPMTIRDYIGHIATLMNIPFKNENDTFTNYDRILQTDPYVQINEDDGSIQPMDYTIRDVLDELSQVTASTICINADDELELRDINITDTNADFEIEGATTQETTTGKNLYKQLETQTLNNVTLTPNSDGSITLNGIASASSNFTLSSQSLEAGNYSFQCKYVGTLPNDANSRCQVWVPSQSLGLNVNNRDYNEFVHSRELESNATDVQFRIRIENGFNYQNVKLYPLLVKGTYTSETIGDFEKYTGGMPAPNPYYPMPVINKTGEIEEEINGELRKINLGSVELCGIGDYKDKARRSKGKNLVNIEDFSYTLNDWYYYDKKLNYGIEADKTYTISYDAESTLEPFDMQVGLLNSNGSYVFDIKTQGNNHNGRVYATFSVSQARIDQYTNQIAFRPVRYGNKETASIKVSNVMLVEGSIDFDYEPYYPKGTWYKRSAIGKFVFDGSESWGNNGSQNLDNTIYLYSSAIDSLSINNPSMYYSNYFIKKGLWNKDEEGIEILSNNNKVRLRINKTKATTTNEFRTWLSSNNTELWFPLANPTYEPITDTTAIRSLNDTGLDEIDEEYLKDVNVKFGEKYGPVNSLVLSRSANSDNIYRKDNESIVENGLCELRIADNLILNNNDRDEYIDAIFDKVKGLEYFVNDYSSTGVCYYDLLDRYDVKVEGNHYPCIMLNDEINVTQGLVEEIHADALEHSETDYTKADKTDRKINQTTLIVDKQNGIITAKVEALDKNYQDLNNNLYGENGDIAKLGTRIDQKVDSITFNTYKERIDNGDVVIDNTMVLINDEGINVSTDDSKISTQITNNAFEIKDSSGTELAFFGYDETENTSKSQFDNLNITRYLTAGNHRIEKCGTSLERTGWFYIGGSQ